MLVALILVTLALAVPASAARKPKPVDRAWTHPDAARFRVDRIAMLPVATFDHRGEAELEVAERAGVALRATGYRWISAATSRVMLRSQPDGDSLLRVARDGMLAGARVDSLLAPVLCARLRCDAVLTFRVDLWEQRTIEWNQSGKPSTLVQLKGSLVGSDGSLLWSAAGSESKEGPYQTPTVNPGRDGGVERRPAGVEQAAPPFAEALDPLLGRWAASFPPHAAPASSPPPADSLTLVRPNPER